MACLLIVSAAMWRRREARFHFISTIRIQSTSFAPTALRMFASHDHDAHRGLISSNVGDEEAGPKFAARTAAKYPAHAV